MAMLKVSISPIAVVLALISILAAQHVDVASAARVVQGDAAASSTDHNLVPQEPHAPVVIDATRSDDDSPIPPAVN